MRNALRRLRDATPVRALGDAARAWSDDRCATMAAALAFYAAFSLAPMLVIVIAIAGYFVGAEAVQGRLIGEIRGLVGQDGAAVVQAMLASAWRSGHGGASTWISAGGVALGASATFAQLTQSLDTIWRHPASPRPLLALVRVRLTSFGLVVGIAFLVVVLLVLDAAVSFAIERVLGVDQATRRWASLAQRGVVLLALVAAFAALLKVLPAATVRWRNALVGALAGAVLFSVGKNLFALYLSRAGTASAFGAAGSLAVLLMWLYFSAAVFLYGAEISARWRRSGERPVLPETPSARDDDPARPLA